MLNFSRFLFAGAQCEESFVLRDQVILIIHNKRKKVKKRQSNAPGRTGRERGKKYTA